MAEPQNDDTDMNKAQPYSWYVLGVLVVVYILNFIDRQVVSILAIDIKQHLDLTDSEMGFLGGASFAVFYALFGIPLGRLGDNWNRVQLLIIALAFRSNMTVLCDLPRTPYRLSFA